MSDEKKVLFNEIVGIDNLLEISDEDAKKIFDYVENEEEDDNEPS